MADKEPDMADKLIIDCSTGNEHTEPWTAEDQADENVVTQAEADTEVEAQPDKDTRSRAKGWSKITKLFKNVFGS